jgi:hypothetical protein
MAVYSPENGNGFGGGIYNSGPSSFVAAAGLSRLTVLDEARGAAAGAAGTSAGLGAVGGIWSAGILEVLSSQLAHNQAKGGDGTSGANAGNGFGGGLSVAGGTASITDSTIGHNEAPCRQRYRRGQWWERLRWRRLCRRGQHRNRQCFGYYPQHGRRWQWR